MQIRHPPTIARVGILTSAPWKRYAIGALFVGLYAVAGKLWYETAGNPYDWALEEQKRTLREKAAVAKEKGVAFTSGKQDRKETDLDIDHESLPSKLLPSAWSCALIFFTISSHILFHLMCVWSIRFKAMCLFQPSKRLVPGYFMWLTPHANKGKAAICKVEESEVTLRFTFTFQYQSFECLEPGEEDPDLVGEVDAVGVRLIHCPTNLKWQEYRNSRGLRTDTEVETAQDKYGTNVFELPRPTFLDLFKKQLMQPLAIFQFFCTALWMMDTYWRYTCFTLVSILGFEASTAFQRLKSMATLRGMSMKTYPVWVFRMGKWQEHPIEELLPGDIISLITKKPEPKAEGEENAPPKPENKHLTVPCDCLVIRGSAIVNEATLTGESVPQMKDALSVASDGDAPVDAFGKHRIHALFSGTSLIQVTPAPKDEGSNDELQCPPDGGILCYVLRTGFTLPRGSSCA
jgi:cation-transporting ATPase 13A1